jgi:hypothetical protein
MASRVEILKVDVYDAVHETVWNYLIDVLGEPSGERLGDYHTIHGSLMARTVKEINAEMQGILKAKV